MTRLNRLGVLTTRNGLILLALSLGQPALAYDFSHELEKGWDGSVQFGAQATFGVTDTQTASVQTEVSFRGNAFENELIAKFHRSMSEATLVRRDANGQELRDERGMLLTERITTITSDKRFVSLQPRWYFSSRYYVFALLDLEINHPLDIENTARQITGIGYKLWKSKQDYISASVGVGRKQLSQLSGSSEEGAIGYAAIRLKRVVSETVKLALGVGSDFGGENRFSEIEASVALQLSELVAIKFKYEAQFNSRLIRPWDSFNEDLAESSLSLNLVVDVF